MFLFNCGYRAVNTGCKNNIDIRRRRAVRDQAANDKIYDLGTAALPRGVGKNEQHTLAGTDQIFQRLGINRPVSAEPISTSESGPDPIPVVRISKLLCS